MAPTGKTRRSDRIELELRITVSGTDAQGRDFMEETYTTIVGRHGAKVVLSRPLVPDQELTIRCEGSGRESDARVVGQLGEDVEGKYYSVKFLDSQVDVWGIEFPPLPEAERAVARVLLECIRCRNRELNYLDEFETEVFEANHQVSHPCKQCRDTTLWRQSVGDATTELQSPSLASRPVAARTTNERRHTRVDLNVRACVRSAQFGAEVVSTTNASRGGFAFNSSHSYVVGMVVQVSVPYSSAGGNIFTPARIAHVKDSPQDEKKIIGVAYIPVHKGWLTE
jgi:PilZ domain